MKKGISLIVVMWMIVILMVLVFASFSQSTIAVNKKMYQDTIALAEIGVETARGLCQMQGIQGWSSQNNPSAGVTLSSATEGTIHYAAAAVKGQQAYGIAVANGGNTIGYYAFKVLTGPPISVYSLGALGSSAGSIQNVWEVHAQLKPVAYSNYSYFSANPNETVNIVDATTDNITGAPLSSVCATCTTPQYHNYARGSTVTPIPGQQSLSFDKQYEAGTLNLDLSSNNLFTGFSNANYNVRGSGVNVTGNAVNLATAGGTSGLFTNSTGIGLPNATQLDALMQSYFAQALQHGIVVYPDVSSANGVSNPAPTASTWVYNASNPTNISSPTLETVNQSAGTATPTTWIPTQRWNPNVSSDLSSCFTPPCNPLTALITINGNSITINNVNNYDLVVFVNGVKKTVLQGQYTAPGSANGITINAAGLQDRIVFTQGSVALGGQNLNGTGAEQSSSGEFTVVNPGTTMITSDLVSQSFLSQSNFSTTPPALSQSSSDNTTVITAYQVLLAPITKDVFGSNLTHPNPATGTPESYSNDFMVSAALIELGSPNTLPAAWNPPSSSSPTWNATNATYGNAFHDLNSDFQYTIKLNDNELNMPLWNWQGGRNKWYTLGYNYSLCGANCPAYNNIYLYGMQMQWQRNGNWRLGYYTNSNEFYNKNYFSLNPSDAPFLSNGMNVSMFHEVTHPGGQELTHSNQ